MHARPETFRHDSAAHSGSRKSTARKLSRSTRSCAALDESVTSGSEAALLAKRAQLLYVAAQPFEFLPIDVLTL
jgi:hypothetical protein